MLSNILSRQTLVTLTAAGISALLLSSCCTMPKGYQDNVENRNCTSHPLLSNIDLAKERKERQAQVYKSSEERRTAAGGITRPVSPKTEAVPNPAPVMQEQPAAVPVIEAPAEDTIKESVIFNEPVSAVAMTASVSTPAPMAEPEYQYEGAPDDVIMPAPSITPAVEPVSMPLPAPVVPQESTAPTSLAPTAMQQRQGNYVVSYAEGTVSSAAAPRNAVASVSYDWAGTADKILGQTASTLRPLMDRLYIEAAYANNPAYDAAFDQALRQAAVRQGMQIIPQPELGVYQLHYTVDQDNAGDLVASLAMVASTGNVISEEQTVVVPQGVAPQMMMPLPTIE